MTRLPALRSGLVTDTTSGELVVLDLETGGAHLLKGAAADAFRACESGSGSATDEGLLALADAGLLVQDPTRRRALATAAVVGGALVTTLAMPSLASAASTTGGTGGGGAGGTSTYFGNALTPRTNLDGYTDFYFAVDAPVLPAGTLTAFDGYAQASGSVYGVILSPAFQVLYTSPTASVTAGGTFSIPSSFAVPAGSLLGLGIIGGSVVPFDNGGPDIHYTDDSTGKPSVGDTLPQQGTSPRTYSFGADITV